MKHIIICMLAGAAMLSAQTKTVGPQGQGVGTGDRSAFLDALGGTTAGKALFQMVNPSAITFPRVNADNTVSLRSLADVRSDIGAAALAGPQTFSGAQSFSGSVLFSNTARPTSAGTGVPASNSLITEADMREQYVADVSNIYVRQQMGWDAGPWVTVGASPSYLLDGNGVAGARLIGPTTQAAASAQGGGVKYPDGGVTGGAMTSLTRAFQLRFLFRNVGGQAGANAFFLSLRNNTDFWSTSSVGLYHVAQPANAWQAGTVYVSGDRVNVSGIVHVVSTGGTSGGSAPSWTATRNGTTTDNTVTWRNLGPHTSSKWALGFVDGSGVITLIDTGVAWVAGTTNTTLLSLRSDGSSVFASVNGSAEVSVARGALTAATPYIMGRGDTNLTHRIHGLLFTFTTASQ